MSYADHLQELSQGKLNGVFIDDTGSPGTPTLGHRLHPQRKSWVSVIVPYYQMSEVIELFMQTIPALNTIQRSNVKEFHFGDIYAGRNLYSNINLDQRLAIFKFMAFIFQKFSFPILVQTLDPINHKEIMERGNFNERLGVFNFSKHEDLALFFLLCRTKELITKDKSLSGNISSVFIDEGYKKAGSALKINYWKDWIAKGLIHFGRSDEISPIQLADFAAFCLNRSQIILGKETMSETDSKFLEIMSPIIWNYQNIPKFSLEALNLKNLISKN